jgi:WD40 repeat protein
MGARVWDAQDGKPITLPLRHAAAAVFSACFNKDGTRVVTASFDNTAKVWDAKTGSMILSLQLGEEVNSAVFSPDGAYIATVSGDAARLWDAQTGRPAAPPFQHLSAVYSAIFSPDGTRVLTTSSDNSVRVWDAKSGQMIAPPVLHKAGITSAKFNANGSRIVTASADGTARVWDAESCQPIIAPFQHPWGVNSADVSSDGTYVITACNDGIARVWDVAPTSDSPKWLPDLLEAASCQLDYSGTPKPLTAEKLSRIRHERLASSPTDQWEVFGRWLFAEPDKRTISPWSSVTVAEYLKRLIAEGTTTSLDEANKLAYGHPDWQAEIKSKRSVTSP